MSGKVTASSSVRPTRTRLQAVADGIPSAELVLTVSPGFHSIIVSANQMAAHVGDTITLRFSAFDSVGAIVPGALMQIHDFTPGLLEWIADRDGSGFTSLDPGVRAIARKPGSSKLTALGAHIMGRTPISGDPVVISIDAF